MRHTFDRRDVIIASTVGVIGFLVSVAGSGNASLWGDEAASILSAERPLTSLAAMVQHVDAVHALYYLGLHFWVDAFGASPFSVRFPSAIAIGFACAGVFFVGKLLHGVRFGVLAGVVAAALPRLTDVGSEARSYATTAAIATWLSLVLLLILRADPPRRRLWVAYGILLAIGTSLFIWLALVAVSHLLVLVITRSGGGSSRPRILASWALSSGIAIVAASPVLIFALFERNQIAYLANRQAYTVPSLFVSPWFESQSVAIGGWILVLGGVALTLRAVASAPRRRRATLLVPVLWMVFPSVVLLGVSAFVAVYTPRYLALSAPAVALLMAIPVEAFMASRRRVEAGVTLAVVLALAAPTWAAQRGPYAKNNSDWAQISSQLGTHAHAGDAVAFDNAVRPSRRTRLAMSTYPAGFVGLLDPTLRTPFADNVTWYDSSYSLAQADALGRLDGVRRIWLVEYAISGATDTDGIAALESAGFRKATTLRDYRSTIFEFERS